MSSYIRLVTERSAEKKKRHELYLLGTAKKEALNLKVFNVQVTVHRDKFL